MLDDSLKKRYVYKLSSNLISLGANVVIQSIVPRELGPKNYGNFSFLTSFFQQVINFFNLWTTPCFFIKLSQRPKDRGLISFTFYFVAIISVILLSSLIIIPGDSAIYRDIWPGQDNTYLIMAASWGIMFWILQLLNGMSDAFGLTVKSEKGRTIQKIFGLVLIVLLYFFNELNLTSYFYYYFITMFFLMAYLIWTMEKNGFRLMMHWKLSLIRTKNYFHEFFTYSHPLFFVGVAALLTALLDRWLLQYYAGSVEQGFYGLSYQIGLVSFLFTGAMSPLIMREFSIAYDKNKMSEIAVIFRKYIPLLFSIAAYFSIFISTEAVKVVNIMGGKEYSNAAITVAIMSFYPIHQTYGQLSSSVFLATGQTKLYSKIGIVFMLLGLPLTYFFLAPKAQMGLDAGATGLAIKMVAVQFLAVNAQLYFNAKYLNLNFWKYVAHQFVSIISLVLISQLSMLIVDNLFIFKSNIFLNFFLDGVIYTLMVILLVYFQPRIFALNRNDIDKIVDIIKLWRKKIKR